jgi:acetylornithine deacetylase/succinyl-diaminopimelate desuccinylase-like protein
VGDPAVADLNGPLVPRLLELYARHSGEPDPKPISIRGGTYARLFPQAVSFGPSLPGRPYRGHAPDEYLELRSVEILTRALFDLAVEPPR